MDILIDKIFYGDMLMKFSQKLIWRLFSFYIGLYAFLYAGYILMITLAHSSYSIISIPAILFPFLFLLLFELALSKKTDSYGKQAKKLKTKLTVITILSSMTLLFCIVVLGVNEYHSHFTTEKWLHNESKRVYMVDDLLNDHELKEKTKADVIRLLGLPTETDYFKEDHNIVYYLGNERGLISIDSEWLVINFNNQEKVTSYKILAD